MKIFPKDVDSDLESSIKKFEHDYIVKLPEDYYQFIMICNGGLLDSNNNPFPEFKEVKEFYGFSNKISDREKIVTYFNDLSDKLDINYNGMPLFEYLIRKNILIIGSTIENYLIIYNLFTEDISLINFINKLEVYLCTGFRKFANSINSSKKKLISVENYAKGIRRHGRKPMLEDIDDYYKIKRLRLGLNNNRKSIEVKLC